MVNHVRQSNPRFLSEKLDCFRRPHIALIFLFEDYRGHFTRLDLDRKNLLYVFEWVFEPKTLLFQQSKIMIYNYLGFTSIRIL